MINKTSASIQQCYINIIQVLKHYNIPLYATLIAQQTDRIMLLPQADWVQEFNDRTSFRPWSLFIDDLHSGNGFGTAVKGWRENVGWYSMQVVQHKSGAFEFDIDICNPDYGLAPAIGHLIEVLWPGKTDPYRVRKGLIGRGMNIPLVK